MAQSEIANATSKTESDGLDRKVTIEVIHKQEGWGAAAWTAIGMLLIVAAFGSWFMLSDGDSSGGVGLFGSDGNCGDDIDNDNDGLTDEADGDCYDQVNPTFQGYNKNHSEDGRNDPPNDE